MVPLAIGRGTGAEIQAALARVVIGGLLASTMVTLVLIPVVYASVAVLRTPAGRWTGRLHNSLNVGAFVTDKNKWLLHVTFSVRAGQVPVRGMHAMNGKFTIGLLVVFLVLGTGLAFLPSIACHSTGSATDPGGDSQSQEAVQTIDATLTCDPQFSTLPATIGICVNIQNLVDSPRVVDGQIDLWLGGGSPLYQWRFEVVELSAGETWEKCWTNQLLALQSLEDKNIARLRVVDVTPPPYNQPPYPPSGSTAEDVCFFWGIRP